MPSPEVNITIHRTPHVTREDFHDLPMLLKNKAHQIYAPEASGLDDSFRQGLQKVANGDGRVYADVQSRTDPTTAWAELFSSVFNTRKTIALFDATPEQERREATLRTFGETAIRLDTVTPEVLVAQSLQSTQRLAEYIRLRDETIAGNVARTLPELLAASPKLRALPAIGILMTLGDNHQLVHRLLSDQGFEVNINEIPVLGIQEESGIKLLNGETLTDTDILQTAAYKLLRHFVKHSSTYELRRHLNVCAARMDEKSIADVLSLLQKKGPEGVHDYIRGSLIIAGQNNSLTFTEPSAEQTPAIRLKQTAEMRGGIQGIRTGIF